MSDDEPNALSEAFGACAIDADELSEPERDLKNDPSLQDEVGVEIPVDTGEDLDHIEIVEADLEDVDQQGAGDVPVDPRAVFFQVHNHPAHVDGNGGFVLFDTGAVRSWDGEFAVGNNDLGNIYCVTNDGNEYITVSAGMPDGENVSMWTWDTTMASNPSWEEELDEMALQMPYRITRIVDGQQVDSGFMFGEFQHAVQPFLNTCANPHGATAVHLARDDMQGFVFTHKVNEPCGECDAVFNLRDVCFFCHNCTEQCPDSCGEMPSEPSLDTWAEVLVSHGDETLPEDAVVDASHFMADIVLGGDDDGEAFDPHAENILSLKEKCKRLTEECNILREAMNVPDGDDEDVDKAGMAEADRKTWQVRIYPRYEKVMDKVHVAFEPTDADMPTYSLTTDAVYQTIDGIIERVKDVSLWGSSGDGDWLAVSKELPFDSAFKYSYHILKAERADEWKDALALIERTKACKGSTDVYCLVCYRVREYEADTEWQFCQGRDAWFCPDCKTSVSKCEPASGICYLCKVGLNPLPTKVIVADDPGVPDMAGIAPVAVRFDTITLTFGDTAENHVGNQQMGKRIEEGEGFCFGDLQRAGIYLAKRGAKVKLHRLHEEGLSGTEYYKEAECAWVLVAYGGLNALMGDGFADKLMEEQSVLKVDKHTLMYGTVRNKNARWNLCFASIEEEQEPDYKLGKGRVVPFDKVPLTKALKRALELLGDGALVGEGNYYYDINHCGIGFHGDAERRKVIGVRMGKPSPLHYFWHAGKERVGKRIEIPLGHGDLYMMSEKAVGTDWRRKKVLTLRHATGCKTFVE